MADRSPWRQRSWTRNALAVIEIEIQVSWIQVQLGDPQEQNRYDELVSRAGYWIAALLHRLLLFSRIIHLLLNVFP